MKNKDKLISAIGCLFHSWGGDTPEEVYWGANELIDFFNAEYDLTIPHFTRDQDTWESNFDEVIDYINTNL